MIESDLEYLRRRAAEELQRAKDCKDRKVASVHRRLAELYADRAAAMSDNPGFDPIVITRAPV